MIIATTFVGAVLGHGAITYPPSRNSIDSDQMPWSGKIPYPVPFEPWCPMPSQDAAVSDPGRNLTGQNGQACFWFSNGCAIGCDACDGNTRGPIPMFDCVEGQSKTNCSLTPDPSNSHMEFGPKAPICTGPQKSTFPRKATICDPAQRTVNTGATCGSTEDYFFFSPWRAPGSAPTIDPCGTAGGRIPGQGDGGFGAQFQNTTHAKVGDIGSKLPHTPTGVTWTAGVNYEVAWTLQANHGGGYSYRLCPLGENLTEACFQQRPLDFVGQSKFRWGGAEGRTLSFDAVTVGGDQTTPKGSMWRKNPIPRTWRDAEGNWGKGSNQFQTGEGFQPYCNDEGIDKAGNQHSCTSEWGPYNMEIVDVVTMPADLVPGPYVLGFRWDCEESNQIWSSCADIEIVA